MTDARWEKAIAFTLEDEGGYANVKQDRGGETYRGIARKFHRSWPGWTTIDRRKPIRRGQVFPELEQLVRAFYYEKFWLANRCEKLPFPLSLALFDYCVNSPARTARKALQRAVGAQPDGQVGPRTLARMRARVARDGADSVAMRIVDQRLQNFIRIVRRRPSQLVFLLGWMRRLIRLTAAINRA